MSANQNNDGKKKKYDFGGVKEFSLEEIEKEILNETVYLDVFAGSDSRFKVDVKSFENGLDKVMQLDAVQYHYDTEKFSDKNFPKEEQVGFIAQAVDKVVPQAVKKDTDGYNYVNYQMLVPVLADAVKELNKTVQTQNSLIQKLEDRINELESNKVVRANKDSMIEKEN